jgi:hypothetical protein
VAVTGRATSPGLFDVLALLGREETLARLERLGTFLLRQSEARGDSGAHGLTRSH